MKKKILIIFAICAVVSMALYGYFVVYPNIMLRETLKTEINGVVFETLDYRAENDVVLQGGEYKYMLITKIELSITNNNLVPFSFQAKSLSVDYNNGDIFNFRSSRNTSTSETVTDKNESITISESTQTVFEFVFEWEFGTTTVGTWMGNEEEMKAAINSQITENKKIFVGVGSDFQRFSLNYLTTSIASAPINMHYNSADSLIRYPY